VGSFQAAPVFEMGWKKDTGVFLMLLLQNIDWSATRDTVCAVIYI
jgi:hypothetical protein